MRRRVRLTGCRPPGCWPRPGCVTSMRPAASLRSSSSAVEFRLARLERGADLVAHGVDARARGLAFVRRQRAERLQLRGDRALLAEQLDLERFEVGEARAGRDPRPGVCRQVVEAEGRGRVAHRAVCPAQLVQVKKAGALARPGLRRRNLETRGALPCLQLTRRRGGSSWPARPACRTLRCRAPRGPRASCGRSRGRRP